MAVFRKRTGNDTGRGTHTGDRGLSGRSPRRITPLRRPMPRCPASRSRCIRPPQTTSVRHLHRRHRRAQLRDRSQALDNGCGCRHRSGDRRHRLGALRRLSRSYPRLRHLSAAPHGTGLRGSNCLVVRSEIDRINSRQLIDQDAFETKIDQLLTRQGELRGEQSRVLDLIAKAQDQNLKLGPDSSFVGVHTNNGPADRVLRASPRPHRLSPRNSRSRRRLCARRGYRTCFPPACAAGTGRRSAG